MDTEKAMLRLLSCGSVDDGKSTLIGRLLHDCGTLYEDQLEMLERERTPEGLPDFSRLLDGLLAEREQAITIDVAYRTFRTDRRRYLIADAPGHEQYTRNMVTGASRADVALLLVDAVRAAGGLLPQTIRHSIVCALMGVPDIIVAVNKMDCVGYDQSVFAAIEREYRERTASLDFRSITFLPVSALRGDTICRHGGSMDWYGGPTLLEVLENIEPVGRDEGALRFPVQWVARQPGFRGLAGTVLSGKMRVGERVALLPSGQASVIKRIVRLDGDLEEARPEEAVCVQLADDVDVGRGETLVGENARLEMADHFSARMVWLNEPPLVTGRSYIFRLGATQATATVAEISSRIDLETMREAPAKELHVNDIGRVKLTLDRNVAFEPYAANHDLGGFILVDRVGGNTLGAGMIDFALRRSHSVTWQRFELDKAAYAARKGQRPCVFWFTGLSASGKSTIANLAAKILHAEGRHVYILDGDNLRHGLNSDLGFTESDRAENIRRASEAAALLVDAGLIVLASFITPYRNDRIAVRERFAPEEFIEIFVDTPLSVCEERDPKGLYKKARAGELPNFTGIDALFEIPENPDLRLDGGKDPSELARQVVEFAAARITRS